MGDTDTTNANADELKTGRRHNAADQAHINAIVESAIALGADHPRIGPEVPKSTEWTPDEKTLVTFGEPIKALGDGRVGGYLVRFGSPDQPDLTGDYFTAETDFGPHADTPIYYNHGMDGLLKRTIIGSGKMTRDAVGVWVEAQLLARGEYLDYIQAIYGLIESGKMGWSSGTAAHLVERVPADGGKAWRITSWPLGLDASVTPTPAEPRNNAIPLKAFSESVQTVEWPVLNGTRDTEKPSTKSTHKETTKMGDETTTTAPVVRDDLAAKLDAMTASLSALTAGFEAMKKAPVIPGAGIAEIVATGQTPAVMTNAQKQTMADEQLAALKSYASREIGADAWRAHNVKLAANQAELESAWRAMVRDPLNAYKRTDYDRAMKATLVESAGSLGLNLVPTRYSNTLVGTLMEASIMRMAGATILPVEGTTAFEVPTITRSGSAPLTAELVAATESNPTFGKVTFVPYAYRAMYLASREVFADTRIPMDSILMQNAGWQLTQSENNHFGAGSGSTQPQGINQATTAVSSGSAGTLTYDNLVDLMHSVPYQYRPGAAWFMHDATAAKIRKLRDGGGGAASLGAPLWQPSVIAGQPDRLLNAPVYTLNSMASSGSASNTIVYGDPRFFWIADFMTGGTEFQVLNELYAASAAIGWWFWRRFDSHIMVSEAFRGLRFV